MEPAPAAPKSPSGSGSLLSLALSKTIRTELATKDGGYDSSENEDGPGGLKSQPDSPIVKPGGLLKTWSFSAIQDLSVTASPERQTPDRKRGSAKSRFGPSATAASTTNASPMHAEAGASDSVQQGGEHATKRATIASWDGLRHPGASDLSSTDDTDTESSQPVIIRDRGSSRWSMPAPAPAMKPTWSSPNLRGIDVSGASSSAGQLVAASARARSFRRFKTCYTVGKVLGTGGFAVVRECMCTRTGERFAVKIMNVGKEEDDGDEEMSREEIINELALMQRLSHPNIINVHEFFLTETKCYIVMDLLSGPELMDALEEHGEYTEADVKKIMSSLIDAISYMHMQRITHRDLKLENLVLARKNDLSSVTIVDFGLAKSIRKRQKMQEMCGTAWYASPELLMERPYTNKVDTWAAGIAMFVLLTGSFPFDDDDEDEVIGQILDSSNRLSFDTKDFASVSEDAKDLLRGLLQKNPANRLSACDALEHKFFTGIATHDAETLSHVHARLERLGNVQKLRRVSFGGGVTIAEGCSMDEFRNAYLIKKGECEILICEPPDGRKAHAPAAASTPREWKVATLREGNFIGFLDMSFRERKGSVEPKISSSLNSPQFHRHMENRLGAGRIVAEDDDDDEGVASCSEQPMQMAGTHESFFLSMLGSLGKFDGGAGGRNMPSENAHIVFRAVTKVTALQLSHEDMAWAVEQDFRLSDDFKKAITLRRRKLRKMERERRIDAASSM